jgi:bacterioferritin
MQGSDHVLNELKSLLTSELSAADQYFVHSQMYLNWGFMRLYSHLEHERQEELEHATLLIKRILFLEGIPGVLARRSLRIGSTVPEMLKNDLAYELSVGNDLKKAIAVCESERDFESRELLVGLLRATEEDHTHWLEVQLGLIDRMGLQNYLQLNATS